MFTVPEETTGQRLNSWDFLKAQEWDKGIKEEIKGGKEIKREKEIKGEIKGEIMKLGKGTTHCRKCKLVKKNRHSRDKHHRRTEGSR